MIEIASSPKVNQTCLNQATEDFIERFKKIKVFLRVDHHGDGVQTLFAYRDVSFLDGQHFDLVQSID